MDCPQPNPTIMMISRRKLLTQSIKGGVGLLALNQLPVFAAPSVIWGKRAQTDRYSAVYKRLDEFITRHMDEIGAPGMTVAIAKDGSAFA